MAAPKRFSVVVWDDAYASLEEQTENDVLAGHRPNVIHTYGYVLRSDPIGVSIASEYLPATGGSEDTYRGVTFIPRAIVREERTLPKHRARKPKQEGGPT